jgi:muconolactone D-isomerase
MEWLVSIEVSWPSDGDAARREELLVAERRRVEELSRDGLLRRLWRVPGSWASWSIWEAPDAAGLHAALSSLPLWPWMSIRVQPLAAHDLDPADHSNSAAAA